MNTLSRRDPSSVFFPRRACFGFCIPDWLKPFVTCIVVTIVVDPVPGIAQQIDFDDLARGTELSLGVSVVDSATGRSASGQTEPPEDDNLPNLFLAKSRDPGPFAASIVETREAMLDALTATVSGEAIQDSTLTIADNLHLEPIRKPFLPMVREC